jgi:hypothetical protein
MTAADTSWMTRRVSVLTPRAGRITFWAGVLGAASGLFLAVRPSAAPVDQWSYPQPVLEFGLTQTWFAIQHMGLALGIWELWELMRRRARFGYYAAWGGMLAISLTELVAIIPATQPMDAPMVVALGAVYGVVTVVIGAGLVALGVTALRSGVLVGLRRWIPLSLGVWVFFPMLPGIAVSFLAARLTIAGWMLLFATLGWILTKSERVSDVA